MSDWIMHTSDEQPVADDVLVETLFDDGSGEINTADTWCWDQGIGPVKYRIVEVLV